MILIYVYLKPKMPMQDKEKIAIDHIEPYSLMNNNGSNFRTFAKIINHIFSSLNFIFSIK